MIRLKEARVFKYKSIEDSSLVPIAKNVTVLVGKNESGKTAFLEALYKALPLGKEEAQFNYVFDYPRKDYVRYRPQHQAKTYTNVVNLTFQIANKLVDKINTELFHGAKVVPEGYTFTRTTHYGNGHMIGVDIDQAAALAALKKPEAAKLALDTTLGAFAQTWRGHFAKAASGWSMVDLHIWRTYLAPLLPHFLYFDDYRLLAGKLNLESLNQRVATKTITDADETALGLFELAGITLRELMSEEGYENSKAKLEAIGLTITEQVFRYWKQNQDPPGTPTLAVEFDVKSDPTDQAPFNAGKNLYIRVKNLRHGVTVPFDQRSKGFIWFFSFMVWFTSVENRVGTDRDIFLLLDEPGLNLHALAQADFLNFIRDLSETRQIIYTTHSPFMVESERLEDVRVVEDRPKQGTKVTSDLQTSADESLFPLQAALGYSVAQNLFITKKNVLLEGPADFILLQHMSSLLEQIGKEGLREGTFVPVGGLDKLATFIALLGASKLTIVVLHDRASAPHQGLEEMIRQRLIQRKRILDFSLFRMPSNLETDIEDLFPETLYIDAFNAAYNKELKGTQLTSADLITQHPRIINRINDWLTQKAIVLLKKGGFNHYRVAQALLSMLTEASLSVSDIERFEALFASINQALG